MAKRGIQQKVKPPAKPGNVPQKAIERAVEGVRTRRQPSGRVTQIEPRIGHREGENVGN